MPIKFKCPHCKKGLQVKDHLAGKKGACPQCKKSLLIPTPATTTAPADVPPEPPIDVEALAAAALQDEPTNGKQAETVADTIDFKCEFCQADVQVPRADAGKRMQCPNPECRSIIKVPAPKDGPKKLPTVAQLQQQVEKIDEAAWGTQTDKARVHKESFEEAGVLPDKAAPIGPRGWIRRGLWAMAVTAAVAVAAFATTRVNTTVKEKGFVEHALAYVDESRKGDKNELVQSPLARAAVYRAIARFRMHFGAEKKRLEQLEALQKARASLGLQPGAPSSVERDLFLGELALTVTELGGSEDEDRAKEKYDWKGNELSNELLNILKSIRAPEAKLIAMRALVTRLLELEQYELALGLASQLSNPEGGRKPPVTSQLVVLLLLKDKPVEKHCQPPRPNEVPEPLARVGFAEFHLRKGNVDEAKALAFANGPIRDRLEACVGVAQVILQSKNGKPADAVEFVDKALDLLSKTDAKKMSPWLVLQTIRLGARVKNTDAVRDLPKKLPPEFQPRAYLEILLAEADTSSEAMGSASLSDIRDANADSPSLDFGWEALARQHARLGKKDIQQEVADPENQRFRAMVHIGKGLSALDGHR